MRERPSKDRILTQSQTRSQHGVSKGLGSLWRGPEGRALAVSYTKSRPCGRLLLLLGVQSLSEGVELCVEFRGRLAVENLA